MANVTATFLPPNWKPGDPIPNTNTPSPTVTIGESQATSANNGFANNGGGAAFGNPNITRQGQAGGATQVDDAPPKAPTSPGVGAGTTNDTVTSVRPDDTPGLTNTQQVLSQTFGNGTQNTTIVAQPNVLDQYASYTYGLSWYLLNPTQYNNFTLTQPFNTAGWQLLMQSGGAPTAGRNQFFPVDYYMDDLEIESLIPLGGSGLPYSAVSLKWKVTEPNGITLIQQLYNAVNSLYKNTTPAAGMPGSDQAGPPASFANSTVSANQSALTINYASAQYCMVIRFYGYDAQGNLVAPAKGQYTTNNQLGGPTQAVITKYYPFIIKNITYRVAKAQIEYIITALPVPHMYNSSTDRGTIPFAFALTGQTVGQLLSGTGAGTAGTATGDPNARTSSPNLPSASNAQQLPAQPDDATTAALFNDGTGYTPGYDPSAGWSA
jgi:hypothetical protein